MEKIVVLGNSGSGKSTLTKKMADILKIPYLHLDTIVWKHDWQEKELDQIENTIYQFIQQKQWICDGNFLKKASERFAQCDTIIFLDMNRWLCFFRVIKRYFKYKNKPRESRSVLCNEKLDSSFLKWVRTDFYKQSRPKILELCSNSNKNVIILKNKKEVNKFLTSLVNQNSN
ncbi:MAG TPA: ATP-binding cassette domain-containing protein [Candidatus Caccosoma faecigallinarum]|uniref:ATP-binding cassette domain-containing protein n=1 Tax=Candidatus Caccosoma faecigallinarum TaxID=2840720 RepID=A0A9D1KA71_9FIRM|nr:dNA topology modulation protein [Firmicutes bacterium CAG:631]HIT17439.1 ATP-binding cassette domain-containing protein [Candidatus Caccosoma faecigallinarum]